MFLTFKICYFIGSNFFYIKKREIQFKFNIFECARILSPWWRRRRRRRPGGRVFAIPMYYIQKMHLYRYLPPSTACVQNNRFYQKVLHEMINRNDDRFKKISVHCQSAFCNDKHWAVVIVIVVVNI